MTAQATRMHLRFAALALIATSLAGCGLVPKKEPLALYAPEARVQADPAWPTVAWQLQIPRPHASELLDSPRIVVRPSDGELQVYHGAIWAEPAPDMVQDAVLHAFEDSGRIRGVARRGSGVAGDYELLLDIRRFQSDYAGGSVPNAEVEIVAKLIANRTNTVVATRTVRQSVPAGGTAIDEVSRAFGTALSATVQEIVGWTLAEGQQYDAANPSPTVGR
jgi:cholesterol transport system auxiliary component